MQSYVENSNKANLNRLDAETANDWMPADDASVEMSAEQNMSSQFCTLSEDDTRALEEMSASRVKAPKPEPLAKYRKPKNQLFSNFPPFASAFKQGIFVAMAVGLVVAFFVGMSGIKSGAPANVARVAEPTHVKTIAPRKISRSAPTPSGYRAAIPASRVAGSSAPIASPVISSAPVPEYKGPSSVTGLPVPHRRAYQASTITAAPEQ